MHGILITGAANGIGAGLATELAAQGHHIFVTDLKLAEAEEVAAQIRRCGRSRRGCRARRDLAAERRLGPREPVAAGRRADQQRRSPARGPARGLSATEVAALDRRDADRRGALDTEPFFRECARGFGRVINIGSIHSLVASPTRAPMSPPSTGCSGFSKSLALETADVDITICTICPSYVRTALVDKQIADQAATRGIAERRSDIDSVMLAPHAERCVHRLRRDRCDYLVSHVERSSQRHRAGDRHRRGWTAR